MDKITFTVDELFEDIPGDPENVIMKIPPEVIEQTGWKVGDTLCIEADNGSIVLSKK